MSADETQTANETPAVAPFSFAYSVVLAIAHAGVALPLALRLNVWSDEASTLYTTRLGLAATFANVFADEKQAPLYFLLLSLWRSINSSVGFARTLSVAFSVIAIFAFYDIARRVLSDRGARIATAFFALHPFLVWASLEIRVYSLVVLLACLLIRFFITGFLNDDKTSRSIYFIVAIIALYTNYYLGFLLVGNFAALLLLRPRSARRYLVQMVGVAVFFAPLVWMIGSQLAQVSDDVPTPRSVIEGIRLVWSSVTTFLLPAVLFSDDDPTTVAIVRTWLVRLFVVVAAVFLLARRRRPPTFVSAFGSISAVVAAFLLVAYFALGVIYVEIRHAAVLFPSLILLASVVVAAMFENLDAKFARPLTSVLAVAFAVAFGFAIVSLYPEGAKRGDWIRIADYIEQREIPGQPIIVFTVFDALSLPNHYEGPNRILPDEHFFNWGAEAAYGTPESLRRETDFVISKIPSDAPEIWLATGERCQTTKACETLENYVRANYTVAEDKEFYKERLRLLRKIQR